MKGVQMSKCWNSKDSQEIAKRRDQNARHLKKLEKENAGT
jgi:hypothetical protein